MMSLENIRRIAASEVEKCCYGIPLLSYKVTVIPALKQPRIVNIYWDVVKRKKNGDGTYRATAVDIDDSEAMVRYRIRSMFAYPEQTCSLYGESEVYVMDHPTEKPPE